MYALNLSMYVRIRSKYNVIFINENTIFIDENTKNMHKIASFPIFSTLTLTGLIVGFTTFKVLGLNSVGSSSSSGSRLCFFILLGNLLHLFHLEVDWVSSSYWEIFFIYFNLEERIFLNPFRSSNRIILE